MARWENCSDHAALLQFQSFQEREIGRGGRMVFLENDIGNTGSFLGGDTCVHGRTIASAPGLYRDPGSGAGIRSVLAVGGVGM